MVTRVPSGSDSALRMDALRSTPSGKSSNLQLSKTPTGRSVGPRRPKTDPNEQSMKRGSSAADGSPLMASWSIRHRLKEMPDMSGPSSSKQNSGTITSEMMMGL